MKPKLILPLLLCWLTSFPVIVGANEPASLSLAEAVNQPDWIFLTGGQSEWFPQTEKSKDGISAAQSGSLGHSRESWLTTTIAAPGTISFWWKVSSEQGYDFLEFYIDNIRMDRISGEVDWTKRTYTLDEGEQTLRWTYTKDHSISRGADAGWVDLIVFEHRDPIRVLPEEPWDIVSYFSHPANSTRIYSVSSYEGEPLNWAVSPDVDWLEIEEIVQGDLEAQVTVRTTEKTAEKEIGTYEGALIFENIATGVERVRPVVLTVKPPPGEIEVTDSITPFDDHTLPFGEVSLGLTKTGTIRIRNMDLENNLQVKRVFLRPHQNNNQAFNSGTMVSLVENFSDESVSSSAARERGNGAKNRPPRAPDWSQPHDPSTLLVRFKQPASPEIRASVHAALGSRVANRLNRIPVDVVELPSQANPRALLAAYQNNPNVEYAEPNYRLGIGQIPNDTRFSDQWSLHNTGQNGGLPGADISALDAWQWTTGSEEIIVAVIDTGIDYDHPDLAGNMWVNPNPTFGDIHGARWTGGNGLVTSGDPMDDNSHGTHVAGIAGAVSNNAAGIAGVSWNVRLMALKFLDANGFGSTADAIAALEYAINHGAHLTNNSWGGGGYSQALKDMIEVAQGQNQLFVAAAGNENSNNDITPSYPASYALDNIISVANSDRSDNRSFFSNYGLTTVHLAAPGTDILSTVVGGSYQSFSGTSMAAPHVAGVAALILSLNPTADYSDVKKTILEGVTPLPQWENLVISGGRLNAIESLKSLVTEFRVHNLPSFPLTLAPGRSLLLEVAYEPRSPEDHQAVVVIESDDLSDPEIEVSLSGRGVADALSVLESEEMLSEGFISGPFAPIQKTYTLQNNGEGSVTWTAASPTSWLTVNPASGSLTTGAQQIVTVTINEGANALPEGTQLGTVRFTNTVSGLSVTRSVYLRVLPFPGNLVVLDSILPDDDLNLPFPWILPGNERVEQITFFNSHDSNDLIIDDIRLLGSYREDFENEELLEWWPDPLESWTVNNKRYQASNPGANRFMQSLYTGEVWENGLFETAILRQGPKETSAVLILRASPDFNLDQSQGTALIIGASGNGNYFVARFINGTFTWIQPWTPSSFLFTDNRPNVLSANLYEDNLHLFANDQLLWSGRTGGPFRAGYVGLAGYTEASSPTIHRFPYVEVREALTGELPSLSLEQAWNNAHPSSHDNYATVAFPLDIGPPPPGKQSQATEGPVALFEVLKRQDTFRLSNLPDMPLRIGPGQDAHLEVIFSPSGEGSFNRTLRVFSNDPDHPEIDLTISGSSEKDALRITPLGTFVATGEAGGTFSPSGKTFTLHNTGLDPAEWSIVEVPAWLNVSVDSGLVPAGGSTDFTLYIRRGAAAALPHQIHAGSVTMQNMESGFVRSIPVELHVRPALCESLKACDLTWTSGGATPWMGQKEVTFRSDTAAQSGLIGDNQQSWIQTTVEGPGRISFWWLVSSEENWDFLQFQVNGGVRAAISGETGWEKVTIELPEGQQILRWRYIKDFIFSEGMDSGWVDEVSWTPIPPVRRIASEEKLSFGVVPAGGSATRTLTVNNPGNSTLSISDVSFSDGYAVEWTSATIAPGVSRDLVVTFTPTSVGPHPGLLSFTSDAHGGVHEVELLGFGALEDTPLEVANEETIPGLTAEDGHQQRFFIDVLPGRDLLEIRIFGGTGDADLYVRHGAPPTLQDFDYAPWEVGNNEKVFVAQPASGRWYFMIHAYEPFADVSVQARYSLLTLGSWASWIGLPGEKQGKMDRHGPLGITTLTGYAFGRDPRLFSLTDLPRIERTGGADTVQVIYRVNREASDVSVIIETSVDLHQWQTASPASEIVLSDLDGVEVREATVETGEMSALFIRARIESHEEIQSQTE